MPNDNIQQAIDALERAVQEKRDELLRLEKALAALQQSTGQQARPRSAEYADIGITEAARRYLQEVGEPRATRDIADAIRQRGLATASRNFIATVYATLANSRQQFARHEGLWTLASGAAKGRQKRDKSGRSPKA
jgi:hypothetical protein